MNIFLQHLNSPEYMHVLLNPVPVYGLALGVVGLLLAVIARNRTGIVIALVLVFLSGLSAWPTYHYGEAAYDRVKAMANTTGDQWLDEHMARGEKLIYAFYVLAGLALVGMFAPMKWPRSSLPLAIATLLIGCATLGIGFYIAYAGGHVRHREFRFEAPPRMAEHHHEEEQHGAETHEHAAEQRPAASAQPLPEHAGHEQMQQPQQPGGEKAKTEEEQKRLEASRLQLEASRLQLEASRKQLEAAGGASPTASASGSPSAAATAQPSPEQHKHDEHQHDEHKP